MIDGGWIKPRIAEAKADHPLVTQSVVARIEELLNGPLSDREFSKGDLTRIAKELISEMASVPPRAEAKQ